MTPLELMPVEVARSVSFVFTDIDDTITTDGQLEPEAYAALWDLHRAGLEVVPVTGRPAGWCDHIARMWPVAGVVGENGALAFTYDRPRRVMRTLHAQDAGTRLTNRARLERLQQAILRDVPGAGVASDQPFRLYDLAIDFCEDVPALPPSEVARIVAHFHDAGATAKVSSIHVNGWFGRFDKLSMMKRWAKEERGLDLHDPEIRGRALYVGDSPNDGPGFGFFEHSVGVANVCDFEGQLDPAPRYVTTQRAGRGFVELARRLMGARRYTPPGFTRMGGPPGRAS